MEESSPKEFSNAQLGLDNLPSIEDLEMIHLEKKYFNIMIINALIFYVVLLIAGLYAWFLDKEGIVRPYFQWILLAFLALFITNIFFLYKGFQFKSYAFRQHDITYKSGWLWRKVTTVPFSRVQHCEVSQNILDRIWNLGRIKIFTAGGSSSDVKIPGLNHEVANELKSFILKKAEEYE